MAKRFPEAEIKKVKELLEKKKNIVITTHHRPDGDAMGSSLALYNYLKSCLLYTSPSPRDRTRSRMPSSA